MYKRQGICISEIFFFQLIGGIDPIHGHGLPAVDLPGFEPQFDFVFGGLHGVRTVTNVAANLE